ncbi:hypothetical protein CPC08DRAFT_770989 [Agrocybe pediades]|nr:hypothetical protein CPC08DRAFT_770989 [Agrocybe pediades]
MSAGPADIPGLFPPEQFRIELVAFDDREDCYHHHRRPPSRHAASLLHTTPVLSIALDRSSASCQHQTSSDYPHQLALASTVQNSVPAPYPPPTTAKDTYTCTGLSPQTNPRSVGSQHIISSLAVQSPARDATLNHKLPKEDMLKWAIPLAPTFRCTSIL